MQRDSESIKQLGPLTSVLKIKGVQTGVVYSLHRHLCVYKTVRSSRTNLQQRGYPTIIYFNSIWHLSIALPSVGDLTSVPSHGESLAVCSVFLPSTPPLSSPLLARSPSRLEAA
jgi:hypothetical protein